jgi:hypothetical protein
VDPTRGARIRTEAAREQKSDRAQRRLPLRAHNDRDFEDVVVRNAHPAHARPRDLVAADSIRSDRTDPADTDRHAFPQQRSDAPKESRTHRLSR